jgi:hypothetical protein
MQYLRGYGGLSAGEFNGDYLNCAQFRLLSGATFLKMLILSLCQEENHWKLIPGYAAAFRRRGIEFFCPDESILPNAPLSEFLRACRVPPTWIVHFECNRPILPDGIVRSEIPTVYFDVDTYAYTHRRIRWGSLFDHIAVFHPGYEDQFHRAGHPGAFLLPHAVRGEFFEGPDPNREFELGWVGQSSGPIYRKRAEWLPKLSAAFRTNDLSRSYTQSEVADVYRHSRIVVNIGRDDFPQDANLRVFEVLASGALLVTALPTELSRIGFKENVHFVGYQQEGDIVPIVRKYLLEEESRWRIAEAARRKVLDEHTYDARVEQLLTHLQQQGTRKLAPARFWPERRARLMALDFFASHGALGCAASEFRHLAGRGLQETVEGLALLARAGIKKF